MTAALRVEGVTKLYAGVRALADVDFDVHAGAVNVIIGENGAGKSTLMKIIAGVERPTAGRILIDGEPVTFADSAAAARAGVGMVFQELNLFPNLSITENIFMAREKCRFAVDIDQAAQERRTVEILAWLKQPFDPRMQVDSLTVGQQQIVEIARALAQDARFLILDEPTSALSSAEAEILFGVIAELKRRGVGIIYISHRLDELMRIGDHVTILRDGRVTARDLMANVDAGWIVRHMTGSTQDLTSPRPAAAGAELLRLTDLCLPRARGGMAVDHVSLTVRSGEILGIYGLLGAGRTELLESIIGCRPDATGEIHVGGRLVTATDVHGRIAAGMALVPEDRRHHGFVGTFSIAHNLTLASLSRFSRLLGLDLRREAATVTEAIERFGIKARDGAQPVTALSGGNQQKVVIGKALLTNPKVLLMDEPTRGVDVGAKASLYRLMRQLATDGLGILFATSELEELLALSDRIAVMSEGRITAILDRADATVERITAAASPRAHAHAA